MQILECRPTRGFFKPHEIIEIKVGLKADQPAAAKLQLVVSHMKTEVARQEKDIVHFMGETWMQFNVPPISRQPQGYGLKVEILDPAGNILDCRYSAVDTLNDWTDFPRYGFLTDFTAQRTDLDDALDSMASFHLNGIQFYDWQYRHDELLSPVEEFVDPLGRSLSMPTVRSLIKGAHCRGMAAMPYLAVYAASLEFWKAHPDWRLFDEQGKAIDFEGFLGLMDPTSGGAWIEHLAQECERVLAEMPFDGLHVDQYGEPKIAFDSQGTAVDLPQAFTDFVTQLKESFPGQTVVFNAVGNWPIDELAASLQDFVYIEIWPPKVTFKDVLQIVSDARAKSGGKPVVIALYLPAERPVNIRLANAVIMACGGSRIELGENGRLLSDPYFPKHEERSPQLVQAMQAYQDFLVRYSELLGPEAENMSEITDMQLPKNVVAVPRRNGKLWGVNLINFSGLESPRWDEAQISPTPLRDVPISIPVAEMPEQVWIASPDGDSPELTALHFIYQEGQVKLTLPEFDLWSLLLIQFENEVNG
jgi:dextranase